MSLNSTRRIAAALVCFACLAAPRGAGAAEGVVQIGQATLDATGFPFVISTPGRYRLVSNLTVPDQNTTAISVNAVDGVDIDLNGFAILGPNTCTYSTSTDSLSCTANGVGDGIEAASATGVTIRNGIVRGMGRHGVAAGNRSHVEAVSVFDNGGEGIRLADFALATNCIAVRNQGNGIRIVGSSSATDNVARHTGSHGVHLAGSRSSASGNVVSEVGGSGVNLGSMSTVAGNVARDAANGIFGEDQNTVSRNVVYQSRSIGIRLDDGNLLRENVAAGSGSTGIAVGIDNTLVRNVSVANTGSDMTRDGTAGASNHVRENYIDDSSLVGGSSFPAGNCCAGSSQFVFSGTCNPEP